MTLVVTGRTRTLTWSGDLAGSARLGYDLNLTVFSRRGGFSAAACGCAVSAVSTVGALTGTLDVTATNGITSDSDGLAFQADDPVESMNGSWSISADVEECYEVDVLFPDLVDADGYPIFGGAALKDGPIGRKVRYFERLRVGGTVTATITCGSLTATATSVVTSGTVRAAAYNLEMEVDGEVQNQTETYSISGGSVDGGWGASTYSHSETVGGGTAAISIGAASEVVTAALTLTAPIGSDPFAVNVANGEAAASAVRASGYEVSGRALRWTDTYDGQLTAHVKTTATTGEDVVSNSSGQWSGYSVTHRVWSASSTLMGIGQPTDSGGVPATSCRIYLTGASLTARGEDARDWRLYIAGKPYRALTVNHAATSSLASLPVNAEGYRYIRVQHRSVGAANQAWTLGIGGKSWNLTTGADGVTVTSLVDLCNPDSETQQTDGKQSRYPLDAPGGNPVDSAYWGVSVIGSVVYTKPPEVEVISRELFRESGNAHLSWVPALTPWLDAWTSPTDTTRHKPHGWSEVDGRIADIPAAFFVDVSGPGDYYSHQTIEQSRSRLDSFGGWTASLYGSWPDSYHNGDRDAWYLGGGGHVWRGYPGGAWQSEIDRTVSGSTDVWAQALWDEVEGYPGIGDAWERTDYPSPSDSAAVKRLPVRFSKILRGQGWGIVLGPDGVSVASGDTVNLRRSSDNADRGSDTTDSRGSYKTGSPYGQGEVTHYVEVGDVDTAGFSAHNRMRHRWVIADNPTGGQMSLHIANDNRIYRAYVKDGTVRFGFADRLLSWTDRDTGTGADWVNVRLDRNCVAHLVYEDGGEVKLTSSYDDGTTWLMPTTIATGKKPTIVIGPDNKRYLYWIDGTTVKGQIRDAAGVVVESTFTALAGPVDDQGVAADIAKGVGFTQTVVLLVVVSGSLTQYVSTDGKTFS